MNTNIKVCGKEFDTETKVILWNEEAGLSFYPYGKYEKRNYSLNQLQKEIDSFFIHHSVTYTAHSAYRGMIGRGLSVNFLIDDDINDNGCATIYQALDVVDVGYSQKHHNYKGSGVEICYYPDYWENANRYSQANIDKWGVQPHPIKEDRIRGYRFPKVFGPTDAQVKSCIKLINGYKKAFPDLIMGFPRDEYGHFLATTVEENKRIGLLHHFNVDTNKIDALGFPTDYVETEVKKYAQMQLIRAKAKNNASIINRLLSVFRKK